VELWLIRHALPVREVRTEGGADPELTAEGHEQARLLAEHWAPFGADAVISSPMRRARETAAPLATALGVTATIVDDIAEYDAHLPTYTPVEDLMNDPAAWEAVVAEWLSPEAEEARQAFREKVVTAIDGIAAAAEGAERLAIVCHGGVINAYLSKTLHLPGTMFFEPTYTCVNRLMWKDGHRQFVSANEAPHLGAPRRPAVTL
jgi:probable phosphoglycerate mutase